MSKDESPQLLNQLYEEHDNNEPQNNCESKLPTNKINYINKWMTDVNIDESISEISSSTNNASTSDNASTSVYSSSVVDDDEEFEQQLNSSLATKKITTTTNNLHCLENILETTNNNTKTVENFNIENSKNIHIGNVTYITGPIHVSHNNDNDENTKTNTNSKLVKNFIENDERRKTNSNNIFFGSINRVISNEVLSFIERRTWLAQNPLKPYDYLQGPADFVIISHTATQMGTTQAENIYLIRHIQSFHIESNRWNDIAYNFLIGCDGNIYEGRGWGVIGAHTLGYNSKSIGISFVGCFMGELPFTHSLDACKNLIKRGVELGHISPNYKLLGHCQCRPFESPGKMLFNEIKCWPNFCNDI